MASPSPESLNSQPSLYLTPIVIAVSILVSAVLILVALHFLFKRLRNRVHPAIPQMVQPRRHGVDKKVLDSILIQSYKKKHHRHQECAVCLSGFGEADPIRVLPICRHVFHVQCIDAWFSGHCTCPFCRLEVTGESVVVPVEEVKQESRVDGEIRRANTILVCVDDDFRLMSFREKLKLKRCVSLDSCNV